MSTCLDAVRALLPPELVLTLRWDTVAWRDALLYPARDSPNDAHASEGATAMGNSGHSGNSGNSGNSGSSGRGSTDALDAAEVEWRAFVSLIVSLMVQAESEGMLGGESGTYNESFNESFNEFKAGESGVGGGAMDGVTTGGAGAGGGRGEPAVSLLPGGAAGKESGKDSSFEALLGSDYHWGAAASEGQVLGCLLGSLDVSQYNDNDAGGRSGEGGRGDGGGSGGGGGGGGETKTASRRRRGEWRPTPPAGFVAKTRPADAVAHMASIFVALHLVYEDLKLTSLFTTGGGVSLASALVGMAHAWGAPSYADLYTRDLGGAFAWPCCISSSDSMGTACTASTASTADTVDTTSTADAAVDAPFWSFFSPSGVAPSTPWLEEAAAPITAELRRDAGQRVAGVLRTAGQYTAADDLEDAGERERERERAPYTFPTPYISQFGVCARLTSWWEYIET